MNKNELDEKLTLQDMIEANRRDNPSDGTKFACIVAIIIAAIVFLIVALPYWI